MDKEKLMDALNLLDELAEIGGVDYKEKVAQAKAYNLLANYIEKKDATLQT